MLMIDPHGQAEVVASEALHVHLRRIFSMDVIEAAKQATIAVHSRSHNGADPQQVARIQSSVYGPTGDVIMTDTIAPSHWQTGLERSSSRAGTIAVPGPAPEASGSGGTFDEFGQLQQRETTLSPSVLTRTQTPSVLLPVGHNSQPPWHTSTTASYEPRERHSSAHSSSTAAPQTPKRVSNNQITSPSSTTMSTHGSITRGTRSRSSIGAISGYSPLLEGHIDVEPLTLTPATINDWYSKRLEILPQQVSKTIAKLWVKVIEPEKQSLHPYNKGDAGAPDWWPRSIRHKEPDHLYKAGQSRNAGHLCTLAADTTAPPATLERITLLSTLIRCRRRPMQEYEDALGKRFSQIPDNLMPALVDLIKVAKEERRAVESSQGEPWTYITVLVTPDSAQLLSTSSNASDTASSTMSRSSSMRAIGETTPRARPTPTAQPYSPVRSPSGYDNTTTPGHGGSARGLARSQSMTSRTSREKTPGSVRRKRLSLGGMAGNSFTEVAELDSRLQMAASLQSPRDGSMAAQGYKSSQSSSTTPLSSTTISPIAPAGSSGIYPSVLEPAFASPSMIRSRSQMATTSHLDALKPIDEATDEFGRRTEPTLRRSKGSIALGAATPLKPYSPYSIKLENQESHHSTYTGIKSSRSLSPGAQFRSHSPQSSAVEHKPSRPSQQAAASTFRHSPSLTTFAANASVARSPVLYQAPSFTTAYNAMNAMSPAVKPESTVGIIAHANDTLARAPCPPTQQSASSQYYYTPESLDESLPSVSPVTDTYEGSNGRVEPTYETYSAHAPQHHLLSSSMQGGYATLGMPSMPSRYGYGGFDDVHDHAGAGVEAWDTSSAAFSTLDHRRDVNTFNDSHQQQHTSQYHQHSHHHPVSSIVDTSNWVYTAPESRSVSGSSWT
ncbi:hypothetical protein OIO90_001521 [Microbotryomycetes sp. JL221]|nr:hypothetical protein OIO90_001521 [Microbotryomycetes sp. JL221]